MVGMRRESFVAVCPSCKAALYSGDIFCGNCGRDVELFVEKTIRKEAKRIEREVKNSRQRQAIAEKLEIKKCEEDAFTLLSDCSGDKLAATKMLCARHNLDNQAATKFINSAAEKLDDQTIIKTIIVSQDCRKKAGSTVIRGAVGGALLGPVGLLAGASGANHHTTTFQVIYKSGRQETITTNNGDMAFREYVKYLYTGS